MDMNRSLRLFLVLWTFVVVPTLCPAGVLVHACHEEESSSTSCSHEDDCDADPCLQASTPGERPIAKNLIAFDLVEAPVSLWFAGAESATAESIDPRHANFPRPNAAPFLPGAQPLLI